MMVGMAEEQEERVRRSGGGDGGGGGGHRGSRSRAVSPQAPLSAAVAGGVRSEVLRPSSSSSSSVPPQGPPRVFRERVLVRVYDLGQTVLTRLHNRLTKSYGAFHTGVEVYGHEWSFGMTFDDYSTGVMANLPGQNLDHSFRETLSMGYTSLSPRQVMQIIEEMKEEWKGCTYNVLSRNCHSFSDAFCRRLGVAGLPSWINDLAGTGAGAVEFLDSADSGYDGGTALVEFLGSVKSRVYSAFVGEPAEQWPPDLSSAAGSAARGGGGVALGAESRRGRPQLEPRLHR